jgi:hypothetical protein
VAKRTKNKQSPDCVAAALKAALLDREKLSVLYKVLARSTVLFGGYPERAAVGRAKAEAPASVQPEETVHNVGCPPLPRQMKCLIPHFMETVHNVGRPPLPRQMKCLIPHFMEKTTDPAAEALKNEAREEGRFFLMCFQARADEQARNVEPAEFVPFFSSQSRARHLIKKMKIPEAQVIFRTDSALNFFMMALRSGKKVRLNPGGQESKTFSLDEMVEFIQAAQSSTVTDGKKTKARKDFTVLKEEYSRLVSEKIFSCRPAEDLPNTLGEVMEMARRGFDSRLFFHPAFAEALNPVRDLADEKILRLAWRMLFSLANDYHLLYFNRENFSMDWLIEETGLAVPAASPSAAVPGGDQVSSIFDPLKRDLRIHFSVLEDEKQILLRDLEISSSPPPARQAAEGLQ